AGLPAKGPWDRWKLRGQARSHREIPSPSGNRIDYWGRASRTSIKVYELVSFVCDYRPQWPTAN
ncbi:hypothetical protein, partial [Pseudomonas gingeri]|uniref:hypothetical protein n=1 Tax=Pseudomonas gingeri TaxID=117681 RepID=UPI001AE0AA71